MTEFRAHEYLVGGPVTHGGDIEWEISTQPAGLTQVWDRDGLEWRDFGDASGPFWLPFDADGRLLPHPREASWVELLQEWGPVTDEAPTVKPVDPPMSCGWHDGCTKTAADDYDQLCAEHLAPIAAGRVGYVAEVLLSETPGAGRDGEL